MLIEGELVLSRALLSVGEAAASIPCDGSILNSVQSDGIDDVVHAEWQLSDQCEVNGV